MATRKQVPTTEENWLYKDMAETERVFSKMVFHPQGDPDWAECTDAEKVEWEAEHPIPTPEDGENA